MALLEINNFSVSFARSKGFFKVEETEVVHGLDMSVESGRITAVVGASGSGKSLLAHAIMGILPGNAITRGTMTYNGSLLDEVKKAELRGNKLALIPQSVQYLDPLMKVGEQVSYSFQADQAHKQVHSHEEHKAGSSSRSIRKRLTAKRLPALFQTYGLAHEVKDLYPFELSGGMARRVLLSIATAGDTELIVADEPTPGIHVEALSDTLKHFRAIADQGTGILWITHDISSALQIADEIIIFYAGTNVEKARPSDFIGGGERLRHPYSKALWNALPENEFKTPVKAGSQPKPGDMPKGCLYTARCPLATEKCTEERPLLRELRGGEVRCIHAT